MNFEHLPNRLSEQDIVDSAKRGSSGEIILLVLVALILAALIFR